MHSDHVMEMVTLPSFLGGRGVRSHREVQEIPETKGNFDHVKVILFHLNRNVSCFFLLTDSPASPSSPLSPLAPS